MRLCHHSIQQSQTMKRYRCFVAIHLFLTTTCLILSPSQKFGHGLALQSLPTTLRINQVSQSYPSTLFRTLFSSVPRREFAVHNITLEIESELLDIIGASSSGKSTILRLVLGKDESPISGSVSWRPSGLRPVYLAQGKSPYANDSSQTVHDVLMKLSSDDHDIDYWETAVEHVCNIVGLTSLELQSTPSQLSPSNLHRFGLVCASLESILPALNATNQDVPSPLLLMDEWLDFETSAIVSRVEESMLNLTRHGAVILCVTHKPQLFSKPHRSITMCRGEVLFEQKQSQ